MAAANATLVSKHPSTIMVEAPATVNKKQEMEAKHVKLVRITNERELQVGNNQQQQKPDKQKGEKILAGIEIYYRMLTFFLSVSI